ncbi:NADH dehydrogenase [ubiquinone] 1 alpha subcomplex subunit 1-like [Oculina patagonica]
MWYEALPGLVIIGSCIAATGLGLKVVDRLFQEGKPSRYNVDNFDRRMIERDEKITGSKFRQKAL